MILESKLNPQTIDHLKHMAGRRRTLLWLAMLLVLTFLISILLGRYPSVMILSPDQLAKDELAQRLILNLRLPRLLTAILLGMSLSVAGAVLQMIFSNPLIEPGFIGVSQGAAFGAALCIVFFGSMAWMVQISAAFFAFSGLAFSYFIARRVRYGGWVLRLILSGIAVSALFTSGLGILKYIADPLSQLPEITFWLLGGLWSITWPQFLSILPVVVIALLIIYRMRWRLNLLSLNDETAFSLGATPGRERALLLGASVVAIAAVVSVSGMITWVGIIIPHISRRLFGADSRYMLPASMLIGAIFMIICDDLGRILMAGEIPLGIFTAFMGAAIFIYLMLHQKAPLQ